MKLRQVIFIITAVVVFVILNGMIFQKELLLKRGRTVLLELAPRDPRSLMQGDYMALRYKIAEEAAALVEKEAMTGKLLIRLDENQVGRLAGIYKGRPMAPDELPLMYRDRRDLRLGAESFFFQQGHAHYYENARYGELKVSNTGESVLVGLRDEKFQPLGPHKRQSMCIFMEK